MHTDDGAAVLIDCGDAVTAVVREPREKNVPIGRLDIFVLAGRELEASDSREFAARVGPIVEPFRVGVERGGLEASRGLVRRQVSQPVFAGVPDERCRRRQS